MKSLLREFDEQAQKAIVVAESLSFDFGHQNVGSEHLLLSLLKIHDNQLKRLLQKYDVNDAAVEEDIKRLFGTNDDQPFYMEYSQSVKRILERSIEYAKDKNQDQVTLNILIISLLKLVRPFLMIMLLAIILGVLGHLTATFITVFIILTFCKVISFSLAVKLIILCAFSRGILRYIEQACNHYIAFKVLAHIRHLVFEKLRELAPAKLENEDKGNIIAMLTSDVELLEVFFAHTISPVMIAFIYSIIMICFIDSYHFVFGILAFVCYGIMGILIPYITYKVSQKEGSNYRFLLANYNTFVLETVLGKREIIQFSQQETRFEQMKKHQNDLTQTHQKLIKHQSFQQILSDGLIILSIVISILLIKNHVSKELLIPMMTLSSSFGPTIEATLTIEGGTSNFIVCFPNFFIYNQILS